MSAKLRSLFHSRAGWLLVAAMLIQVGHAVAQGITYPTFNANLEATTSVKLNGSPAFSPGPDGHLWMAYSDVNNGGGLLSIASSTDGLNYTIYHSSINMSSDPTLALYTDSSNVPHLLCAYAVGNTAIQVTEVTGGIFATPTTISLPGNIYDYRPAMAQFGTGLSSTLYLAWEGQSYDPTTGEFDGNWINVATSTNGTSFTLQNNGFYPPVSDTYSAGSGVAMTTYGDNVFLLLTYLERTTGQPVAFRNLTPASTSFTNTLGTTGTEGHYAGDPAQAYFPVSGTIPIMFRSAFGADNLWAIGTTDGVNFGPSYQYGQTLTNSPSLGVDSNGTLYQGGRTNFPSHGAYLWVSNATYSGINPF